MKRILIIALALCLSTCLATGRESRQDKAFGWATIASIQGGEYQLCGGGDSGRTVVLKSNGRDMREDIKKAIRNNDIIVFDGSQGEFIISKAIDIKDIKNKTLKGVNNAIIRTEFSTNKEIVAILDSLNVKDMSSSGGGGTLINGQKVKEEREFNTRKALIEYTGDLSESLRSAGLFKISACENLIIRNIAFQGPGPIDVSGADLISLGGGSHHIWVDHCCFADGMDGNLDITDGSDFITISYCIFRYTEKAYDHKASNLISSRKEADKIDNYNITFAYCIWGEGCNLRMPVARYGTIHLFNNYYNCAGNQNPAISAKAESEFLIENNYFAPGVSKIFKADSDAKAWNFKGNIFSESFSEKDKGSVKVPYKYQLIPAQQIPTLLSSKSGPTL
ncbi:MAG: hypothetical protein II205_05180 [Bacteroidales bacterium]|nr:hypothetical protein [Bacteroidales bacterium]